MKRIFGYLALSMLILGGVAVSQITSNASGDWNTGATWTGGIVPTGTDNVVIQTGHVVTLVASGSCAMLTLNAGATLSLDAASLTIPGSSWSFDAASTVIYNGTTTVQSAPVYGNLTYATSSSGSPNGNLSVNGDFNITTGTFRGNAGTSGNLVHSVVGHVVIGPGISARLSGVNNSSATTGSCTWNIGGNVSLTGNNAGNRLIVFESAGPHTGNSTFNINGNLTIGTSSQLQHRSSSTVNASNGLGTVNVGGNISNSGTIGTTTGATGGCRLILALNGSSPQQYTGSFPGSFAAGQACNIQINNSTGVTLNNAVTVNGNDSLTLVSGKLTTTNTNLLTVSATGAVVGGSASSFIDGPVAHTWTTASEVRIYPLGKGSAYRPLEISFTTPASPVVRAEVFNGNAGGSSALAAISTVRYYQTSLVSGTATGGGTVLITYGGDDGVATPANGVVAQSGTVNGSYTSLGGGDGGSSRITSGAAYNPASGDFLLLGSSSDPLPVQMSALSATSTRTGAMLNWSTTSETNCAGFAIERRTIEKSTADGWQEIGFVKGSGTSSSPNSYSFQDKNPVPNRYAYRIKQVDNDGTFSYAAAAEVVVGAAAKELSLGNYPNPFNPATVIEFTVPSDGHAVVTIFNIAGQEIAKAFDAQAKAGQFYQASFDGSRLSTGVYYYTLEAAGQRIVRRMLMVK